jgi:hypothetical protein
MEALPLEGTVHLGSTHKPATEPLQPSQRSVPAYREYHRMHQDYFTTEVKRYMKTEGEEVGIHSSSSSSPSSSESDAGVHDNTKYKQGTQRKLALGRRTGRGHALSKEEIRAMKEFYQENQHKYPGHSELWERFAELVRTVDCPVCVCTYLTIATSYF